MTLPETFNVGAIVQMGGGKPRLAHLPRRLVPWMFAATAVISCSAKGDATKECDGLSDERENELLSAVDELADRVDRTVDYECVGESAAFGVASIEDLEAELLNGIELDGVILIPADESCELSDAGWQIRVFDQPDGLYSVVATAQNSEIRSC